MGLSTHAKLLLILKNKSPNFVTLFKRSLTDNFIKRM
jgi:hypothetical protein